MPNNEGKKIDLKLWPPKYLVTVSTDNKTDKIPENKNPNNKKGAISINRDHIFNKKSITQFNKKTLNLITSKSFIV